MLFEVKFEPSHLWGWLRLRTRTEVLGAKRGNRAADGRGRIILRRGSRAEGPVRFANAVTRNAVEGEVQEEEKGEDPGKTLCNTYYI